MMEFKTGTSNLKSKYKSKFFFISVKRGQSYLLGPPAL